MIPMNNGLLLILLPQLPPPPPPPQTILPSPCDINSYSSNISLSVGTLKRCQSKRFFLMQGAYILTEAKACSNGYMHGSVSEKMTHRYMGQFPRKLPHGYIIKCYKNASRVNRYNFPTVNAINFLFSTLHTTPFHYGKTYFGALH